MPVTKTAKRALRGSKRKQSQNSVSRSKMEVAIRVAKKKPTEKTMQIAYSLLDRAAKIGLIHKNKSARAKSQLAKLLGKKK